jgi:hypothetical protein
LRDTDSFAIDALYSGTLFGGGDKSWAARMDKAIYFDDIVISTGPTAHEARDATKSRLAPASVQRSDRPCPLWPVLDRTSGNKEAVCQQKT